MRKVLTSFEIFSQPTGLVGKPNPPVHWVRFSEMALWVLCFVYIGSWSFAVIIALCEEFLTKFQNFSQSFGLVENRFNRLCKTAHGQPLF